MHQRDSCAGAVEVGCVVAQTVTFFEPPRNNILLEVVQTVRILARRYHDITIAHFSLSTAVLVDTSTGKPSTGVRDNLKLMRVSRPHKTAHELHKSLSCVGVGRATHI